jgi:hypothetical protein
LIADRNTQLISQELRTSTKETGFFIESAAATKYYRKKPGFWAPMRKPYIRLIRLNLRIQNLRNSIARFLQMSPRISIRIPIQIPNTLAQTLPQLPQLVPSQTPRILRNIRFSQHHSDQNRQMFPLQRTPKSRNLHLLFVGCKTSFQISFCTVSNTSGNLKAVSGADFNSASRSLASASEIAKLATQTAAKK